MISLDKLAYKHIVIYNILSFMFLWTKALSPDLCLAVSSVSSVTVIRHTLQNSVVHWLLTANCLSSCRFKYVFVVHGGTLKEKNMVGFLRWVYCVLMDSNVSYYLYLFVGLALSSQPKMVYRLVISCSIVDSLVDLQSDSSGGIFCGISVFITNPFS